MAAAVAIVLRPASAITMQLSPSDYRCVGEEMEEDSFGKFTFGVDRELSGADASAKAAVRVSVIDPDRRMLYAKVLEFEQDIFAFSTKKPGLHKICFRNNARETRRVVLEVKTDIETKDYSEVIRKEHLKPLELEFLKAEDTMRQVTREFNYMQKREARMKQTSESTASRIRFFAYVSILVLLLLSFWQTVYLKSFFRSKKLL